MAKLGGKKTTDESGQYIGGRQKGKKNLQYEGGKIINQNGVKFTEKEKRELESLVNSANRKRNRLMQEEMSRPLIVAGKDTGKTVGETLTPMGKESDFMLAKKTKSLNKFKTKEEYKKYIKNLKKVVDREYINKRAELYKKNHIKALKNVFGKDSKKAVEAIKKMPIKDYIGKVQSDETLEIKHVYSPEARAANLNRIHSALGISEDDVIALQYAKDMQGGKGRTKSRRKKG